jgi:hypothetical protein
MKSLSQSEYGELKGLYESVYAPKFETILDEMSDDELDELTDELIEEVVEEVYNELLEEGWDVDDIEEVLCESLETSMEFLTEAEVTYGHDTKVKKKKGLLRRVAGGVARKVGNKVRSKGLRGWAHELVKGYGEPGDPGSGGGGYVGSSDSSDGGGSSGSSGSGGGGESSRSSRSSDKPKEKVTASRSKIKGGFSSATEKGATGVANRMKDSDNKKPKPSPKENKVKSAVKKIIGKTARATEKGATGVARRMS